MVRAREWVVGSIANRYAKQIHLMSTVFLLSYLFKKRSRAPKLGTSIIQVRKLRNWLRKLRNWLRELRNWNIHLPSPSSQFSS